MKLRLALAQMRVEGGRKSGNLARALDRIGEAAGRGAQMVVLPEAMTLGWTHPVSDDGPDEVPDSPTLHALRAAARRGGLYVCTGLIERQGGRIFNSAVLIDPQGEVILHHRKLNELGIGHAAYELGDRLGVVDTPFGRIGVMICADAFARGQVIGRTLGYMGARVILSPCAWAVPAGHDNLAEPYGQLWKDNYGPVARDFRLWMVGVSNVGWIEQGPWAGRKCIGCSLVVGPDGEPVLQGPYGVEADVLLDVELEVEPAPARGDGWAERWGRPG